MDGSNVSLNQLVQGLQAADLKITNLIRSDEWPPAQTNGESYWRVFNLAEAEEDKEVIPHHQLDAY